MQRYLFNSRNLICRAKLEKLESVGNAKKNLIIMRAQFDRWETLAQVRQIKSRIIDDHTSLERCLPMTFSKNLTPVIDGIDPNRLIELDGERGSFFIGKAGGRPELEHGFFYGDDRYQFCFYVNLITNTQGKNTLETEIFDATNQRLGQGGQFKAKIDDVNYLENNIRKLFVTRAFFDLRRKLSESDSEVFFAWCISK